MKTITHHPKQVGDFVVSYLANREVAISYKGRIIFRKPLFMSRKKLENFLENAI